MNDAYRRTVELIDESIKQSCMARDVSLDDVRPAPSRRLADAIGGAIHPAVKRDFRPV